MSSEPRFITNRPFTYPCTQVIDRHRSNVVTLVFTDATFGSADEATKMATVVADRLNEIHAPRSYRVTQRRTIQQERQVIVLAHSKEEAEDAALKKYRHYEQDGWYTIQHSGSEPETIVTLFQEPLP